MGLPIGDWRPAAFLALLICPPSLTVHISTRDLLVSSFACGVLASNDLACSHKKRSLSAKRVIQYTGERISQREAMRRTVRMFLAGKAGRGYLVRLNRRSSLDGSVGGSGAEFINHGCDPNMTMRRIRGQVFLYSFRKIRAGAELTIDYGFRCSHPCRCGSSKCRGTMCHA